MTIQWYGAGLDRLVAPDFSKLTHMDAPEIERMPNYFGAFFLNNILRPSQNDGSARLTVVFVRRLAEAFDGYAEGREGLVSFVAALEGSNDAVKAYLKALSGFERAVVSAYLALLACDAVFKLSSPDDAKVFQKGDGSPAERLCQAYTSIKHHHGWTLGPAKSDVPPLWLMPQEVRFPVSLGTTTAALSFAELHELLSDLQVAARFLTEEVYELAEERRKAVQSQSEQGGG